MEQSSYFDKRVLLWEKASNGNTSSTVLNNGATFDGAWDTCDQPYIAVFVDTDQSGVLYIDFSTDEDGANTWTLHTISIAADTAEWRILPKYGLPYFRIRFENNSGSNQTVFTLSTRCTYYDHQPKELSDTISSDELARLVRSMLMAQDGAGDPIDLKANSSGELLTVADIETPTTFDSAQKTVAVAGTAEALAGSTAIKAVSVTALRTNTGNVYIGGSGVDSTGDILSRGASKTIHIDNLASVYIDVDTGGEGVSYAYVA